MWSSSDIFCFYFYITFVILADMLARSSKKIWNTEIDDCGSVSETECHHTSPSICMAFEFKIVAVSSAATCEISEALRRRFVKRHSVIAYSVRSEFGPLKDAYLRS
jgi:hypothetical protein